MGLASWCASAIALMLWVVPSALAVPVEAITTSAASMQVASLFSFSGEQPDDLGVTDGHLASCPPSPNCVSSQDDDEEHGIAPLSYEGEPADAIARLENLIADIENAETIESSDRYLYVQFTSAIMGFVDDVEFYVPEGSDAVEVRSASRLGESDLGVNRRRVEEIRDLFAA